MALPRGALMFLSPPSARGCTASGGSRRRAGSCGSAVVAIAFPFLAATGGLGPDRDGPPAVDRAGPAEDVRRRTRRASAPRRSRRASACSRCCTSRWRRRLRPHAPLRARRPAAAARGERGADGGAGLLGAPWTSRPSGSASSPSSGRATSCSRDSTSASACCCRSCRATSEEREPMFEIDRPGLGRQRGLARRRRGRDVRRLPGVVRDDVLRLLPRAAAHPRAADRARGLVRVARARDGPRWRAAWRWANTVGSVGAAFLWGVALANLVHGVPLDSDGHFTGDVLDLFSAYTVSRASRSSRCSRSTAPST